MFGFGFQELLIVLIIALVIFGPSKLPQIGSGLGKAIRDFRKGMGREELNDLPKQEKSADEEDGTSHEGSTEKVRAGNHPGE